MSERRIGGFANLLAALEYAADLPGQELSWFDGQGRLQHTLNYRQLHDKTRAVAAWLHRRSGAGSGAGLGADKPGRRVGILASTGPDFLAAFCACHWLGWTPCPLPMPAPLQDWTRYARALANMRQAAGMTLLLGPEQALAALEPMEPDMAFGGASLLAFEDAADVARARDDAPPAPRTAAAADDIAYVQFSSGSTGRPRGIAISHRALMSNIDAILQSGLALREQDRAFSWLPYYHDMGLVGFVLAPLCAQVSVDYLAPSAFARRPHLWPGLMAARASTITYAPGFAWQLAARHAAHVAPDAPDASNLRLDALRVAGVGGDHVHFAALQAFAQAFAPRGFNPDAFKPSYGLAEATLAVTMSRTPFEQLRGYFHIDAAARVARVSRREAPGPDTRALVDCGPPLPGWQLEVRDAGGRALPAAIEGEIVVRGPAQLCGYFDHGRLQPVDAGQWIETGDRGFLTAEGRLHITGRSKDLLIVNGCNVWPQDVERAVSESTGLAQEHVLLLQDAGSAAATDATGALALLLHEKAVRRRGGEAEVLALAAAAATAASGARVRACMAPNGTIAITSSGKKARALTAVRFQSGRVPVLADSRSPSLSTSTNIND
jgi:fatty-acyl-CoA synthase